MAQHQQKRKKWTEEEERALMDKYEELQSDGSLRRLRTREKRFRPIAGHVNSGHHSVDPLSYPFLWSWKDASTKVQNMRHQFLLVKQKLLSTSACSDAGGVDWSDGLSLWSNFLRYRAVFGDAPLPGHNPPLLASKPFSSPGSSTAATDPFPPAPDDEAFQFHDTPLPLPSPIPRRKKKKKLDRRSLAFLWDLETRMEEREIQREQDRLQRERAAAHEADVRNKEWEAIRRESLDREARRAEEERLWEERMEQRRAQWRQRTEDMLARHRAEMEQIHARVIQEQHNIAGQLLGMLSQWIGPGTGLGGGLSDGAYFSHMMSGLHHFSGVVPGVNRVDGDGNEDQFIVDD